MQEGLPNPSALGCLVEMQQASCSSSTSQLTGLMFYNNATRPLPVFSPPSAPKSEIIHEHQCLQVCRRHTMKSGENKTSTRNSLYTKMFGIKPFLHQRPCNISIIQNTE